MIGQAIGTCERCGLRAPLNTVLMPGAAHYVNRTFVLREPALCKGCADHVLAHPREILILFACASMARAMRGYV